MAELAIYDTESYRMAQWLTQPKRSEGVNDSYSLSISPKLPVRSRPISDV
jgi:hypothetical protein